MSRKSRAKGRCKKSRARKSISKNKKSRARGVCASKTYTNTNTGNPIYDDQHIEKIITDCAVLGIDDDVNIFFKEANYITGKIYRIPSNKRQPIILNIGAQLHSNLIREYSTQIDNGLRIRDNLVFIPINIVESIVKINPVDNDDLHLLK